MRTSSSTRVEAPRTTKKEKERPNVDLSLVSFFSTGGSPRGSRPTNRWLRSEWCKPRRRERLRRRNPSSCASFASVRKGTSRTRRETRGRATFQGVHPRKKKHANIRWKFAWAGPSVANIRKGRNLAWTCFACANRALSRWRSRLRARCRAGRRWFGVHGCRGSDVAWPQDRSDEKPRLEWVRSRSVASHEIEGRPKR